MPSIFKDIFGGSDDFNNLLNSVDDVINNLPRKNRDTITDDELSVLGMKEISNLISSDGSTEFETLTKVFNNIDVSSDRLARYKLYEDLYSSVQIIKRIVRVYSNSVFLKDPITDRMIIVKDNEAMTDNIKTVAAKEFAEHVIKFFELDERLKEKALFDLLMYGDSFVELIDMDDIKIKYPKPEKENPNKINKLKPFNKRNAKKNKYASDFNVELNYSESIDKLFEFTDISNDIRQDECLLFEHSTSINEDYIPDESSPSDEKLSASEDKKKKEKHIKKFIIKFHRPHNIIKLVTSYGNTIGYLEVGKVSQKTESDSSINPLKSLVDRISTLSSNQSADFSKLTCEEKSDSILRTFSKLIAEKVIKHAEISESDQKSGKSIETALRKNIGDELFYSVKRLLVTTNNKYLFYDKLSVRFIPPNKMFNFVAKSGQYFPYGESVIDPLVHPGTMYLLTQIANVVAKLSRSAQIRKWTLETGSREDSSGILQRFKSSLKNKRITAADLSSSKDIVSLISDYKDLVTFTKRGQSFVDFDIITPPTADDKIRDLEDLRKEIVALSGVPQTYLGYTEGVDLREYLVHSNINFAVEISAIQSVFNKRMGGLLDEISTQVVGYKFTTYAGISLLPPVILTLQLVETTIQSVSNIQGLLGAFKNFPSDPYYLLRRYVPYINWDEYAREGKEFAIKTKLDSGDAPPPDQGF